jgi:hypothetical protein
MARWLQFHSLKKLPLLENIPFHKVRVVAFMAIDELHLSLSQDAGD